MAAMAGDSKAIMAIADRLRDDVLPDIGVRMEDKGSGSSTSTIWKLEDPETLRKERDQKAAEVAAKEAAKVEAARKLAEKAEKGKISPQDMFKGMTDLYSQFAEDGMPTHDAAGEPLAKAQVKKLQKEHSKQGESYQKHLASLDKA